MSALRRSKVLRVVVTTGQVHYIEAYPDETIGDIRKLLSDRYGYPHADMSFTLGGKPATDDLHCGEIEHTSGDYLKCAFPTMKKQFVRDNHTERKCPSHISQSNRWICGSEVVRPKPERQKLAPVDEPPASKAPALVKRVKQVHRVIAPVMGAKKSTPTGASSIDMLLSDGGAQSRPKSCL